MIYKHLKLILFKLTGLCISKQKFKTETKEVTKLLFTWPYLRTVVIIKCKCGGVGGRGICILCGENNIIRINLFNGSRM